MKQPLIWFLLLFGIFTRFLASSWGYTYDMESYEIVAKIVLGGGNIYAETLRYNYGPFWFLLLGMFYKIAQIFPNPFLFFRYEIVTLLCAVDIALFYFLKRHFSVKVAFFYFLNPISILITGFYSQFDAIPLLLGLYAVALYGKDGETVRTKSKMLALVLLGLSLVFKHVLFAFSFWIAIRQRRFIDKLIAFLLPLTIYGVSFLPFVKTGFLGIVNNVFFYLSFRNAPLWHMVMPDSWKLWVSQYAFFLVALIASAFVFRKKNLFQSLVFYWMILVMFSPAIGEQYFVYTLPFMSIFNNVFFILFSAVQTLFMALVAVGGEAQIPGLNMLVDRHVFGFNIQMFFLCLGFLYAIGHHKLKKLSMRQWIMILVAMNLAFLLFYKIPDIVENKKVESIQNALTIGDYETANNLYSATEFHPPFAGSRFWNKLARVRYYVEYYRRFRKAKNVSDREQVRLLLKGMPVDFPYRDEVVEMLKYEK